MSPDLEKCEALALKLSAKERALLAQHLIASLDSHNDAENERLWLEEANQRYQEYRRGGIPSRAAEDVLRDARSAIE